MDVPMKFVLVATAILMVGPGPLIAGSTGLSFEDNRTISGDDVEETNPDIAVSGSGDSASVYIVYEYRDTTSTSRVMLKRSTDGGKTFPSEDAKDFLPSPGSGDKQGRPSIDVLGDRICVVFQDNRNRTSPGLTAENVIVAAISHDGGGNWSESVITPLTEFVYPSSTLCDPNVCIDDDGRMFVVFADEGRVWITYSLDNGTSWEYPQQVQEAADPANLYYVQKSPTVASNGDHAVVAFQSDPDYVQASYFTRAPVPTLGGTMTFDDLKLFSHPVLQGSTPDGWYPRLAEGNGTFHAAYWDFSAEPSGYRNNEDLLSDRPGDSYTRSVDNGSTFGVGSLHRVIVNNSQRSDQWHSMPDISVGSSGFIGIAWYDYTMGMKQPSVFVSGSIDGTRWSVPDRVTNFHPDDYICDLRTGPRIAVDDSGESHVVWVLRDTTSSYGDVQYSRSSPNTFPAIVRNVLVYLDTDEPWSNAKACWDIVREPDFKEYQVHMSNNSGFAPNSSTLLVADPTQGNDTYDITGLVPDTYYYLRVGIMDTGGWSSYSAEVVFRTYPVNIPPSPPTPPFPLVYMQEDTPFLKALNLTWYEEMGYIVDDSYNGHDILWYGIEPWAGQELIEGRISKRNNCTYVDFYPKKKDQVPSEVQSFNLTISDTGRDGIPDNGDDLSTVALIKVQMNATNDPPYWVKFTDLISNQVWSIGASDAYLNLVNASVGAVEGVMYKFSIRGGDVDGDFLRFACSDDRVSAKPDKVLSRDLWIFEFTPSFDDAPLVIFNITMDDYNGGAHVLTIALPVLDAHELPRFMTIAGRPVVEGTNELYMDEESTFEFEVTGTSNELPETVSLRTNLSARIAISRPDTKEFRWNVSVTSTNDDPQDGPILFSLIMEDRLHTFSEARFVVHVNNTPDMPILGTPAIEYFPDYDGKDQFEWGEAVLCPEWGEPVRFVAHATDPDRDPLEYSWTFVNTVNNSRYFRCFGREVSVRFMPSDGRLWGADDEDYSVVLGVKDPFFDPILAYSSIRIFSDDDDDNDGLPDIREKWFFDQLMDSPRYKDFDPEEPVDRDYNDGEWRANYRGYVHYQYYGLLTGEVRQDFLKLLNGSGDPDHDGYPNYMEIGFEIPRSKEEKTEPYSLDMKIGDPFYSMSLNPVPKVREDQGGAMPGWLVFMIAAIVLIIAALAVGFVIILRWDRKRGSEEDAEFDRRINEAQRRDQMVKALYGSKGYDEDFGPDQSTLDDLKVERGGPLYEDGSLQSGEIQLVPAPSFWETMESAADPEIGDAYEELMEMDPEETISTQHLRDRIMKGKLPDKISRADYKELMEVLDRIEE